MKTSKREKHSTAVALSVQLSFLLALLPLGHGQEQWTAKTGDTSLSVTARAGQLFITSLSGTGGALDWIARPVPVSLPAQVFINGAAQPVRWKFSGKADGRPESETTLRFISSEPKLELLSIWQAKSGPGPVEHHFEFVNRSGHDVEVALQPSLTLTLTAPGEHSLENWWVEKGGSRPSEVGTHREPIREGYRFNGRSTPYPENREMVPWMSIQDATGNAGAYFGIEFSGRVGFNVSAAGQPLKVSITAGLDPSEHNFRSRLPDGERFVTPTVFVGCYRGGVDDGANRLHRFVAAHLRPPVSDACYPLVVNNSWGSGMAVD